MDVLLRLRVLIWLFVIALWGMMVYQYLGEEENEARQMKLVAPYQSSRPLPPLLAPAPAPDDPAETRALPQAAPASVGEIAKLPAPSSLSPALEGKRPAARRKKAESSSTARVRVEDRVPSANDMPVPYGFVKTVTRHFVVFSEQYPASERFTVLIENLHSNLMLDLAPFSPWARSERTTIFLFSTQDSYRRVTGRPAWSGGASSINKRKLYIYESEELPGIVAHELTHIYFDGFFHAGMNNPLWLSEGMSTLVQVERGLAAPNWLRENLLRLEQGAGMSIDEFIAVATTSGWPDDKVRLWYAQAYSIVRFLVRTQYRSSFYRFAAHLRDGRPAPEALYRAYGAPYTRMKALEHAWRYELSRTSMAKLNAP
ncbi:MAG: hypothetical protein AAB036_05660 [Elusimicrobiota bacterium]